MRRRYCPLGTDSSCASVETTQGKSRLERDETALTKETNVKCNLCDFSAGESYRSHLFAFSIQTLNKHTPINLILLDRGGYTDPSMVGDARSGALRSDVS